jgi:hypothetical protein
VDGVGNLVRASLAAFARALALALALSAATLGASCMLPSQRREDSLLRTAREFNDGLRWGHDENVTPCLSPADAQGLQSRRADLGDDLVMADEEVTAIKILPGSEKATVTADFSWFSQRQAVVKKVTLEQRWQWLYGRWMLVSQKRVRGDRFPLVPEPLEARR